MMGWYHDGGTAWGSWILMSVMMLAFWALVIFAIVAIFRGVNRNGGPSAPPERMEPPDSLAILRERFARGEIDADEYHAREQVLRGTSGHVTGKG